MDTLKVLKANVCELFGQDFKHAENFSCTRLATKSLLSFFVPL